MNAAHQAALSMGFPRQEHWSRLPFPSPGDLSDPGMEPASPAEVGLFFTTEPPEKPPDTWVLTLIRCDDALLAVQTIFYWGAVLLRVSGVLRLLFHWLHIFF
ncbi:unnamed protein product [Rangifer tarandus platyrhynchus]|uniref:Uncharacterized protein n=2 Tax=Rangifer tarandus platyrhynchus TaxID=3082113 RepID=A0AC59Z1S4_RANTA|nr:unnamed protein product [Rangifer tarandus platyrhynchus]